MDILHFDTYDNNCFYGNNNCYDASFQLSHPMKNIHKIYLKSLEMPVAINNIRSDNSSNILILKVNATTFTVTLANKNYTDINLLIADINSKLALLNSPAILSLVNGLVTLTVVTASSITINNGILANVILGFAKNQTYTNITNVSAINNHLLAYDNFIALYLDIPSKGSSSGSHLISYKIPLNAVSNMVFYLADNNTFTQSIEVSDPNFVLLQFRISVYDRFGYKITSGLDYTFSLGFSYNNDNYEHFVLEEDYIQIN